MMFGYATMKLQVCLAVTLAHKLCAVLAELRKNGTLPIYARTGRRSDVEYEENKPVG